MGLYKTSIIHLYDLSFINYCEENFGINRGVYNTIDSWFYSHGFENILERRKNIICFLEFIKNQDHKKRGYFKFGKGGLKIKLEEYFSKKDVFLESRSCMKLGG